MMVFDSTDAARLGIWELAERILAVGAEGASRVEFLRRVSEYVLAFSGCEELEIRSRERQLSYRWVANAHGTKPIYARIEHDLTLRGDTSEPEALRGAVVQCRRLERWSRDRPSEEMYFHASAKPVVTDWPCLLIIRMDIPAPSGIDTEGKGLFELRSRRPDAIGADDVQLYKYLAKILGWAISNRRAEAALRERVKELTALYSIARCVQRHDLPLDRVLSEVAGAITPGFQFPEAAIAVVSVDGREFFGARRGKADLTLSARIVGNGRHRGTVTVGYLSEELEYPEDAFLQEETALVEAIAAEISVLLEGRAFETEKRKLEAQLRHADRLATVGELAAGVAHELNEPLSEILGFAQLVAKNPCLPEQTIDDIRRIERASIHARDVVRNLLTFARKVPGMREPVDLNKLVVEGLSFLSSRCEKEGIGLVFELADPLPEIVGDPAQLNQVVVNLVVNAIQAMPGGGRLRVATGEVEGQVRLVVSDTGMGMNDQTLASIFIPFFTTKPTAEGTGLGLSVVHGIVASHGGSITVESKLGKGSRFEVRLPTGEAE